MGGGGEMRVSGERGGVVGGGERGGVGGVLGQRRVEAGVGGHEGVVVVGQIEEVVDGEMVGILGVDGEALLRREDGVVVATLEEFRGGFHQKFFFQRRRTMKEKDEREKGE